MSPFNQNWMKQSHSKIGPESVVPSIVQVDGRNGGCSSTPIPFSHLGPSNPKERQGQYA